MSFRQWKYCPGNGQGCECTGIIKEEEEEECSIKDDAATWKATVYNAVRPGAASTSHCTAIKSGAATSSH
jgi:hypothetical protein